MIPFFLVFQIAIQAKVGGKIIARENIKPYRKDVTAKLVIFFFSHSFLLAFCS